MVIINLSARCAGFYYLGPVVKPRGDKRLSTLVLHSLTTPPLTTHATRRAGPGVATTPPMEGNLIHTIAV